MAWESSWAGTSTFRGPGKFKFSGGFGLLELSE